MRATAYPSCSGAAGGATRAGTLPLAHTTSSVIQAFTQTASISASLEVPKRAEVCDTFDVTATITNTGGAGAADLTNVIANIQYDASDVELVGGADDPASVGTVSHGSPKQVTWKFHCLSDNDARFRVSVSGDDEVCDGTKSYTTSYKYIEQIELDVKIITPESCDTFNVCDTFCVTANITDNDSDTDFDSVHATISFPNGGADLATDEQGNYMKEVHGIVDGDTQQVSWTVHCESPGDTDIVVTVDADEYEHSTPTNPNDGYDCSITVEDSVVVQQV